MGSRDEMLEPGQGVRPHWRAFLSALSGLSPEELAQRWDLGLNLLRDNGVTYNVHGDPMGLERPWRLDPLPVLMSAAEWGHVSDAVAQRAQLLDTVLADLYGKRSLIQRGLVPPSLLHANPAYLRPCHGWTPVHGRYLHFYAADLVRGGDGQFRVVADRTESPAGAGYALENRSIVSRVLPELFRSMHVERLAPFFDSLRRSLQLVSPRLTEEPRIVLMTPGPYNETYFEHAFLARHLGLTLVQGEDLTVRDGKVYVKTLTGLQQVDVILRRTGGDWCDPLELRGDSALGVAGLLQSARAGNVAVVNAIGSGLLDGGAILGLLPAMARRLLSEDLMLPSIPSWWCGNPADCAQVLGNLDRMVIRPAFHNRVRPVIGSQLRPAVRDALIQAISARPWEWVAQQVDGLSTVPVWNDGRLEPLHMVLRVFAVNTDRGWQVMPGGLARVAAANDLLTARLQTGGGGSKDVWVLSSPQSIAASAVRSPAPPVRLTRGNRDLPSRVADNMFWLGRYVERTEATTRLLRSGLSGIEEALDQSDMARALYLARTMSHLGLSWPAGALAGDAGQLPKVLIHHHMDPSGSGLAGAVDRVLRVASNLRDRLSIDTWRAMQRLRHELSKMESDTRRGDVIGRLNAIVLTVEALSGLAMENMTRGPLWLFMDAGKRSERSITLVDTLAGAITEAEGEESVPMELLLDIWDSTMTYRSRYLASPRLAGVLDLLICDESNPRSLGFQLAAMSNHMDSLAQASNAAFFTPEQRLMTVLCGIIRTADVAVLAEYDRDSGFRDAEMVLASIRSRLWELSDTIARGYFTHAQWRLPVRAPEFLA